MVEQLNTTTEVIEKLGGSAEVAKITGRKPNAVSNWHSFSHFPPDTYLVMTAALRVRGYEAPNSLWRMVGPAPQTESPEAAA